MVAGFPEVRRLGERDGHLVEDCYSYTKYDDFCDGTFVVDLGVYGLHHMEDDNIYYQESNIHHDHISFFSE